jgi:alpha-1,3-rhamnosyltransferase
MNKNEKFDILVSVIIVSYNSANYIEETLDSVYNQTYDNIELIISDDCSTDNTIEICEKWLSHKKNRFVNTIIIRVDKNSGTAANCNRGVKASCGSWVKLMAADDLFLPDCIANNLKFIESNPDIKIVMSDVQCFYDKKGPEKIEYIMKPEWFVSDTSTAANQYKSLLIKFCGNMTSFFISKSFFENFLYDEEFPFIEDYTFALTASKNGYYLYYMPVETVQYRMRTDSVFFGNTKTNPIFGNFYKKRRKFDQVYRHPYLPIIRKKYEIFQYYRLYTLDFLKLNKNTKLNKAIYKFSGYFNPYYYLLGLNKNL